MGVRSGQAVVENARLWRFFLGVAVRRSRQCQTQHRESGERQVEAFEHEDSLVRIVLFPDVVPTWSGERTRRLAGLALSAESTPGRILHPPRKKCPGRAHS